MNGVRKIENFHIFLWLLKDICWVLDLRVLGVVMITPAVLVAIIITWKTRHNRSELFHNLAVVCWICANSVWMIGEFFYNDNTRPIAIVLFTLGIVAVSYYYMTLLITKVKKSNS